MTPARAVEVATLFEDTVISVRHLTEPPHDGLGRRARRSWPLLAVAAVAFGGSLAAFAASVHEVSVLRRAYDDGFSVGVSHGPFLLPPGGRLLDFAVALSLVVGTWALVAGLGRWWAKRRSVDFLVGPSTRADASAPLDKDTALVLATPDGWSLNLTAPMSGELQLAGLPPSLLASPGLTPIVDGARALVDLGALRFVVQATTTPTRMPRAFRIDWSQESYIGAVGLAAGLFLALLYLIPPDPKSLAIDSFHSDLIAHYIIKAPEPPELPALPQKGPVGSGGGKAHAGPAGAMGTQQAPRDQHALLKIKGSSRDPKMTRAVANSVAAESGIMPILAAMDGSIIGSVFAPARALGPDAENAMGDLIGQHAEANGAWGSNGLDLVGGGPGGGGRHNTTLGVGDLGRSGAGGPGRRGNGPPGGSVDLHPHKIGQVNSFGHLDVITKGGLGKDIVKRVVHAHHNEIRFCYEKRLMAKQLDANQLGGRVVTRFIIAGNGRVVGSSIESSTMNDAAVESCIAEAVRRWDFPRPTDGSVVVVSYPFVLQTQGQ